MMRNGCRLVVLLGMLLPYAFSADADGLRFWRRKEVTKNIKPDEEIRYNPWADESVGEERFTVVRKSARSRTNTSRSAYDSANATSPDNSRASIPTLTPDAPFGVSNQNGMEANDSALFAEATKMKDACAKERPLSWVTTRWGMRVRTSILSDRMTLSSETCSVSLVPGLRQVTVNGKRHTLKEPIVFSQGELMLPADLLCLLPALETPVDCSMVVVLDPGHGGKDPGAIGYGGIREKDVTLKIALYARAILMQRGITVRMTRSGDSYPSLASRADMANRIPSSVFVSIHANASEDRSINGIETYVLADSVTESWRVRNASSQYGPASRTTLASARTASMIRTASSKARTGNDTLADSIHRYLVSRCDDENRGVRKANFHVLRESYFAPATLLEVGFLTHPATARKFRSEAYLKKIALAVADGLCDFGRRSGASGTALAAATSFDHDEK